MAILLLVFQTFLLFVKFVESDFIPYKEKYFTQTLDHFGFDTYSLYTQTTFQQRYLVQDTWWDRGKGPIFFYTGNEGDVTVFWNNTGFLFDNAPTFKALIVFGEHRFYGKSLPFGDKSFQHPYINLLSVEQALADFAVLITELKQLYNATDCNVVTFGGSYGGMLSAWLRLKYPNVVVGALAGSAPIYLMSLDVQRNFFFQDVTQDFRLADPRSVVKIKEAFANLEAMAKEGKSGYQKISKVFNLCKPLSRAGDYRHLLLLIRNAFTGLTMMDYPYPTHFIGPALLPGYPVNVAARYMVEATDVLPALAFVTTMWYGKLSCLDIWSQFVECADPTGCGTGPAALAWDYQACTEMVMPAGSDNVTDMFPSLSFTLSQRIEYCRKRWSVTPRDDWMKINFWGKDLRAASNIIFSNGNLDPWHRGGVLRDISETLVALIVDGGAHHLDLRFNNPKDPASVRKVRAREIQIIRQWLKG